MAKGISIHVGINNVNRTLFPNAPELLGCENDAKEMFKLAQSRGFTAVAPILGQNATFGSVKTAIEDAAKELQEGDIFLFTFAGHGSRKSDTSHDEDDFQDETILLFDRILIDDFLRLALWSQFKAGVRIVGVADCCHSGTVLMSSTNVPTPETVGVFPRRGPVEVLTADLELSASPALAGAPGAEDFSRASRPRRQSGKRGRDDFSNQPLSPYQPRGNRQPGEKMKPTGIPVMREILPEESENHIDSFPNFYEELRDAIPTGDAAKLKANLLTLAACKDSQKTPDGVPNGVFTQALLEVLNSSTSPANYNDLVKEIEKTPRLASRQQIPILRFADPGQDFRGQLPFSI